MVSQTVAKPLGLIKDLRILVHGIPYAMTFIVIWSSVLNSIYFMLLGRPWLKDAKVFRDWGNNIITIQRAGIIKTIPITKNLGAPTKHLKILICYDFHFGIFDEEEDLMFATKLGLFSIGTIIVPTLILLDQLVKLITSTSLNLVSHVTKLVEHVSEPPVLSNVPIKLVHVHPIKIAIPPDTFQQHLLKTFFQLEVGEMDIDETPTQIGVQNLHITS
jgi:hypothetical protein